MISLDLFGLPLVPPRGPGRPRHVPTLETRARVVELRAEGADLPTTAAAIGITGPTLLRHYPIETQTRSQAWRAYQEKDDGSCVAG